MILLISQSCNLKISDRITNEITDDELSEEQFFKLNELATHLNSNGRSDNSTNNEYGVNLSSINPEGTEIDTPAYVRPGGNVIINVNVTNTGNVDEYIEFYDSSTIEGKQEWMLPYGWNIQFPNQLWIEAGETVEQELRISISVNQDLGTYVIYLKGWSSGEPIKSIERGTYDLLEIYIQVEEYQPPILNLSSPKPSDKVDDLQLVLEGEISSCCQEVTIEVGFNRAYFNDEWSAKEFYKAAGEYDNQTISSPDSFSLELNLLSKVSFFSSIEITIQIRICDHRDCFDDTVTIIWFEDADDDGWADSQDAFPYNSNEWLDSDGDWVGDNSDAFPYDHTESADYDGDGVGDNGDAFPYDANETSDTDHDGVGDNADTFPNDANETSDSDDDRVGDNADAFPNDANETTDSDGDGVGDNSDSFPNDANETLDSDGDGIGDNSDECQSSNPSDEVESDGCVLQVTTSETSSLVKPTTIGISIGIIFVTILVFVTVRRNGSNESIFDEEDWDKGNEPILGVNLHEINPVTKLTALNSNVLETGSGVLGDDGYYWLEWPSASGSWYYRAPSEAIWSYFEK